MPDAEYTVIPNTFASETRPSNDDTPALEKASSSDNENTRVLEGRSSSISSACSSHDVDKDSAQEEDSPYESVRAAVANTDDPTMPSLTFRFWILAVPLTIAVSLFNQIFWFRTLSVGIGGMIMQLGVFPLGKLLEHTLPKRTIRLGPLRVPLNPGPFNIKEHTLLSVCTGAATYVAYAVDIVVIKHVFYGRATPIIGSILLVLTTQCIGYGLAGLCYRHLVRPAAMIWPFNLMCVVMFRALHERETTGGLTRIRFFLLVAGISGAYYFLPGFLAPFLSTISVLCLAMPHSLVANQIGSFTKGMGVLSFTLDWNAITSSLTSPLMTPFWAIANTFVGFVIVAWILAPIGYWGNVWEARTYALFGSSLYTARGDAYPVLDMLNADLSLNEEKYAQVGPPRMTFMFAIAYGVGFAALSALLVHVGLHHGREIVGRLRESLTAADDIHAKLMDRYPAVPHWWYLSVLAISSALGIFACEYYETELPWWGVLFAVATAAFFLLPIGIIAAVSNAVPSLEIITELIIGFILPGKPIANVTFKTYGYIGMGQAIVFLGDLKLGHYLKVPPRHMFIAQLTGSLIAGTTNVLVAYMMFSIMPDICRTDAWYCRRAHVFFNTSVVWGVIGPRRMFGAEGYYSALMWWFLLGLLLPVPFWMLARRYPGSWLRHVNIPVLLASTAHMPPNYPGAYPAWFFVGFASWLTLRYRRDWWERYNYILSAALDTGVAFASLIIFFAFTNNGITLDYWGTQPDCPLLKNTL
ncbi:putative oligopeptide transporter [Syncephalis pseudoplumigaleata]|uniref:Putative oligopeptide transporter n=1 Tax=Syncephalis pseudoplumigaleata TaxID=1712513 RepID=A0A4P9YTJ9_9FUNG|nr:putative oligopeptide transporter [Syncephalis pseudoplumigaleata]|eukprot:RKP23247.1 putative oligopeptide transporter [Syncephalis pseudoplumigaleata]